MKQVISDSSPLIAFLKKQEIQLLKDLFGTITIPTAVHQELMAEETSKDIFIERELLEKSIKAGWIKVEQVPKYPIPDLLLGKGEVEAINLSLLDPTCLLLMDEKKGRIIARAYHIQVLGTLGILMLALEKNLRNHTEIKANTKKLLNSGFYLSSELILSFLDAIESGKFEKDY